MDSCTANSSGQALLSYGSHSEAFGSAAAADDAADVVDRNLSSASAVADASKLAVRSDDDTDDGRAAAVSRASNAVASTYDANAVPKSLRVAFEIDVAVRRGSVEVAWTADS